LAARGIFAVALALGAMFLPGAGVDASAASVAAAPTSSRVVVDGAETAFDAYNVKDSNYFKLRDLAYVLNGTGKQFEVGWDESANAIILTSGHAYTPLGDEMAGRSGAAGAAVASRSKILLNGSEVKFTAYNIDGYNYFKLRDVGAAFNFCVDWDGDRNLVTINSGLDYLPAGAAAADLLGHWRYESDEEVELLLYRADATFRLALYVKDTGAAMVVSGAYSVYGNAIYMTDVYIGGKTAEDMTSRFTVGEDLLIVDGYPFSRIPERDAAAVVADPLGHIG